MRLRVLGGLLLLASLLAPCAAPAQDDDAAKAADQAEMKRQDDRAQQVRAEIAQYREKMAQDRFAAMIPAGHKVRRVIEFLSGGQRITLIVDRRLVRDPDMPDDSFIGQGLLSPDDLVNAMYVSVVPLDPSYFGVWCRSNADDGPSCAFYNVQRPRDGYSISGALFVIPGDGCIYSTDDATAFYDGPTRVPVKNCFSDGALRPVKQPL